MPNFATGPSSLVGWQWTSVISATIAYPQSYSVSQSPNLETTRARQSFVAITSLKGKKG